ncbi:MAG TPA: PilZ domain-containing protein [Terriglobales bacterium]|nr:PilZ domain-containing protein [Terriglobales bacterium]
MGRRRATRAKMVLPVRVWGMNALGKPFTQLAHTLDITPTGARLAGFHCDLNLDEVIGIQYRHRKARFRVAWVGRPKAAGDTLIGVQCLELDKNIWGLELEESGQQDEYEPAAHRPERGQERRNQPRFPVAGGVEVRRPFADGSLRGYLADLSLTGCYIQSPEPVRVQSPLRLLMKIADIELDYRGVVRTCHPGVGMGVELTEPVNQADGVRLRFLLQRLLKGEMRPAAPPSSKPDSAQVAGRLQTTCNQLRELEEVLKSVEVDARVLRQFREALGHARNTAWAMQRWIELHAQQDDPFTVHSYLNRERIRLATEICRTLCHDIRVTEPNLPPSELEGLLDAVESLFTQLAGFNVGPAEAEPAPPPALVLVEARPQNAASPEAAAAAPGPQAEPLAAEAEVGELQRAFERQQREAERTAEAASRLLPAEEPSAEIPELTQASFPEDFEHAA